MSHAHAASRWRAGRRGLSYVGRPPTSRDLAKFTVAVALLAIFADAAVGHGLTWENDPYWTYWVTKTFLIATIFGLGTAWLGAGVVPGAIVTAVHTVVLTIYYWTLSPIGLPSHPTWLDLEHTWLTGIPIHFGVIYLGYLVAFWLWRRRTLVDPVAPGAHALGALVAGVVIVVVAGGATALVLWEWPGVTYFVVRLLLTATFLFVWWAIAGRDAVANAAGAVALALAWATYGHYLGPNGLPSTPLRIFDEAPPPAHVRWLDYRDLWLVALPIVLLVAPAVMQLVGSATVHAQPLRRSLVPIGPVVALVVPLVVGLAFVDGGGSRASVTATGDARVEQGEWFSDRLVEAQATLAFEGTDRGGRVTPLEPHDAIALEASVSDPRGTRYELNVDEPLVDDPLGRSTTWWGIGLDVWHHGRSGIGSSKIPATHSAIALFGLGSVIAAGKPVAEGVPVHMMTMDEATPPRLELDVGDPEIPVPGLPDGHLRVVWTSFTSAVDSSQNAQYAIGSVVLVLLLTLVLAAIATEPVEPR
jgi:hypothetical protein